MSSVFSHYSIGNFESFQSWLFKKCSKFLNLGRSPFKIKLCHLVLCLSGLCAPPWHGFNLYGRSRLLCSFFAFKIGEEDESFTNFSVLPICVISTPFAALNCTSGGQEWRDDLSVWSRQQATSLLDNLSVPYLFPQLFIGGGKIICAFHSTF